MGEVYLSRDPGLGRDLALKVLAVRWRGDAEMARRFEQEARVTGSLQHPGIVPVHNYGRLPNGRPYFTMKVVRGRTFAKLPTDSGGAGPEQLAELLGVFAQVCQAVAYAHSKGVIHRDLKPNNVMVGRFGEVQVMDWGLAKVLTQAAEPRPESVTEASELVGLRGEDAGQQTRGRWARRGTWPQSRPTASGSTSTSVPTSSGWAASSAPSSPAEAPSRAADPTR
jgi:serine/threonine-protein kinase